MKRPNQAMRRERLRSSRVHRRTGRYVPTIQTIQQALDMIPSDLDLEKVRNGLRSIVNDEKLWIMLQEAQGIQAESRKVGEAIAKKMKQVKFK